MVGVDEVLQSKQHQEPKRLIYLSNFVWSSSIRDDTSCSAAERYLVLAQPPTHHIRGHSESPFSFNS